MQPLDFRGTLLRGKGRRVPVVQYRNAESDSHHGKESG
jgi:hypothetical protein